jgi:hypothetical protein
MWPSRCRQESEVGEERYVKMVPRLAPAIGIDASHEWSIREAEALFARERKMTCGKSGPVD